MASQQKPLPRLPCCRFRPSQPHLTPQSKLREIITTELSSQCLFCLCVRHDSSKFPSRQSCCRLRGGPSRISGQPWQHAHSCAECATCVAGCHFLLDAQAPSVDGTCRAQGPSGFRTFPRAITESLSVLTLPKIIDTRLQVRSRLVSRTCGKICSRAKSRGYVFEGERP